jgi:hypothetical protein
MKPTRLFLAVAGFALATSASIQAATVFATLQSRDRILGPTAGANATPPFQYFTDVIPNQNFVGSAGSLATSLGTSNFVVGFQLPTLLPGQSITVATFSITKRATTGTAPTVNLSGLATDAPDGTDFYEGPTGNPGDTLIEASFSLPADPTGTLQTADALAFVLSRYSGLTPTGNGEAFFRLNAATEWNGTSIARQNFNLNSETPADAVLELTIIPEPSAALLGGLGTLLLLRRRRQAMA